MLFVIITSSLHFLLFLSITRVDEIQDVKMRFHCFCNHFLISIVQSIFLFYHHRFILLLMSYFVKVQLLLKVLSKCFIASSWLFQHLVNHIP
jgi:hypothetical protein